MLSIKDVSNLFPFRNVPSADGISRLDYRRLKPGGGLFRRDSWSAIGKSMPESAAGMGMFMPVFAYMAAKERPGERLASFGSEVAGVATGFVIAPFVTAACSAVPGFSMLPVGVRSFVGMTVAQVAINQPITQRIAAMIRQAGQYTNRRRSIETGSRYRDSYAASELRMSTIQDMSSSFGAARRYLGKEALYLHG